MGSATPIRWITQAERLTPAGTYGTMSGKGGPRATLHCCVSRTDQFDDMHSVLTMKKAEPHLLYAFANDRLGQYFPLDVSARALMGSAAVPSGVSHNKVGTVNIQIEVVGSTDDWTARPDWRPGPNFRAMMAAIASWGVKPEFIYRPATSSTDRANVVRSFATMTGDAGGGKWWGHCHYPDGESHWDPGRVNVAKFFAAAYGTPTSPLEDDMYTDADRLTEKNRYIDLVARQNKILAAVGAEVVDVDEAALAVALAAELTGPLSDALAAAVAAKPVGQALTREDVDAVVRNVFASASTPPAA